MLALEKNLNIATVEGLNNFIDNDMEREAEECVKYFRQFLGEPKNGKRRSRRREEAYKGWPLLNKSQVDYVIARLENVEVEEKGGIFLIKLIRD